MRPLKLVMTGFESYKEKTEIDFEKLGTQGLYLITGDTGAGKTTIFDAITFALYGSPSGGDRSVEMLRSHFADENTPTRVELDFEVNGKKYHIVRNPEYERKALRGEGITVEAAGASLQCENQEPISGLSKVNQEIEKLLNLRKEQFCSIAMIAQGRFQQLLLSKKDEKEKIFRELFHTEKYERLQNQLKTDKSEAERNVSDLHLRLSEALGRIEVSQQDSDFEKLNQIKTSSFVKEEEIEVLRAFVAKDQGLLAEVLTKISDLETKLEKVSEELSIGEARQKLEDQCKAAEEAQKEKTVELESLLQTKKNAEKEAEVLPELEKEKTLLEASLKDYEEIAKAEKELNALNESISADEKSLALEESKEKDLNEKIESNKKLLADLRNAGENISGLNAALEKIGNEIKELNDIEVLYNNLASNKKKLEDAQKDAKFAIDKADSANKAYAEKLRLFNLEQAGILAETLAEGQPCPVCGSKEHPQLAKKSSQAPTQKEIEEAKKAADQAGKASTEFAVAAAEQKTTVEKESEQINKLLKNHFEEISADSETVIEKIKERKLQLEAEEEAVEEKLKKEEADKKRCKEIEEAIPVYEGDLKKLTDAVVQLTTKISGDKGKYNEGKKNLEEKKSGLKYKTLEEAQQRYSSLQQQINQLNQNVKTTAEKAQACEKEIESLKGEIGGLKNQLERTKPVDMEKLNARKVQFFEEKNALGEQRDSINKRSGINQESLKSVEALVPEIEKATDRYNMISALSEVAAGDRRGKSGKPSLETYVQMHCLDQINRRANLRLKTMTDNKYELRRRIEENGAELGLDLNVKDFYTGRERGVQTLSGGEQFQASLSLALGLADEIQSSSGGIKLDTMFIDEGFGTLDSETLNKAMRALETLSQGDKLIGIISHVEELEARIAKKICVKKDESGVSHAALVED